MVCMNIMISTMIKWLESATEILKLHFKKALYNKAISGVDPE